MDALNYSLFSSASTGVNDSVKLGIISVWLISFLAQTMISLFIPKKDEIAQRLEHHAEVASLIGIFVTPLLTIGLQDPVGPVVNLHNRAQESTLEYGDRGSTLLGSSRDY